MQHYRNCFKIKMPFKKRSLMAAVSAFQLSDDGGKTETAIRDCSKFINLYCYTDTQPTNFWILNIVEK